MASNCGGVGEPPCTKSTLAHPPVLQAIPKDVRAIPLTAHCRARSGADFRHRGWYRGDRRTTSGSAPAPGGVLMPFSAAACWPKAG